jgi:hypothetical protein
MSWLSEAQILNFMKIIPVGAEWFRADRRTYRHDEANSRFSQFCESAEKHLKHLVYRIFKYVKGDNL